MNGTLFVTGQDVIEILKTIHGIVDVQDRSARIPEDAFDTFEQKTPKQDFRSGNHFRLQPFLS
jgi:hypothetical protein